MFRMAKVSTEYKCQAQSSLESAELGLTIFVLFCIGGIILAQAMDQPERDSKPKFISPIAGQRGMTELHYAAYRNDPDDVRAQLSLGVPVDIRDEHGWTPLHWSIDMAQAGGEPEQVVSLLLRAGASANAVDNSGFSVMMMACGRNNEAIFEQLIGGGANIVARSVTGTTALHEAAGCNFTEAVLRLLKLGADPRLTDDRNLTPEQLAERCGFTESASLLRNATHQSGNS